MRGRPKGSKGRETVAIQIRVPPHVAEILERIGRDREDCQYGGLPSPARAVTWLAEEWERVHGSA